MGIQKILLEKICSRLITELSTEFIHKVLRYALEKEHEQMQQNDVVGAIKTGKQFVAIHTKLKHREDRHS